MCEESTLQIWKRKHSQHNQFSFGFTFLLFYLGDNTWGGYKNQRSSRQ